MIKVNNLGKSYFIGKSTPSTLREAITSNVHFWNRKKMHKEEIWACRNINFQVERGEAVAVIGKNGAGKSTLLKLLSRITKPTEGRISLDGRVASLLEVGTGFHPELTGRENIFLNGALLGMKRKEIASNFDEIVAYSGVEKFVETPIKKYSSGMRVRLAFAVAAHLDAEILLIDEVLAVGDTEFQTKCLKTMKSITNTGRTILFVSHNLAIVSNLCSKALLLENGKIALSGTTEECITAYLNKDNFEVSNTAVFDQPTNQPIWMQSIELSSYDSPVSTIHYRDPLTIRVKFKNEIGGPPYFGFVIKSSDGSNVLNANNRYQLSLGEHHRTATFVECHLDALTLMAGDYFIDLFLGDSAVDYHKIQNAISFKVAEKDVWQQGVLPPRAASYLWWPTKFVFGK